MFKELGVLSAIIALLVGCGGTTGNANNYGVQGPTLAAFSGQYAFSIAGFDVGGNAMSMAGSIKADGLGNITTGEIDVNDNGNVTSISSLAGTYAFESNIPPVGSYTFYNNGQGTLGTIALRYTVGTVSEPLAFAFSLLSAGGRGEIMSLDGK